MGSLFDVEKRQIIIKYFSGAKHGPLARLPDEFNVVGLAKSGSRAEQDLGAIVLASPRVGGRADPRTFSCVTGKGEGLVLHARATVGAGGVLAPRRYCLRRWPLTTQAVLVVMGPHAVTVGLEVS